jgi:hypothetical protein
LSLKGYALTPQDFSISDLVFGPVLHRPGDDIILALVMEAALQRLLKEQGTSDSYREVISDLEGVRAVELKANGRSWLVRTELPEKAFQAFKAVGIRPPVHVQPLS